MCIICQNAISLGDAAPRMIICNNTDKPKVLFFEEKGIIENKAASICNELNILNVEFVVEVLEQLAFDLLKAKQKEHTIYYCEDYFAKDLQEYFNVLKYKFNGSQLVFE